jgi:integrase/recombinase XerD
MAAVSGPDAGIVSSDQLVLRAAIAAYLGRYRGQTRLHTESDLRISYGGAPTTAWIR